MRTAFALIFFAGSAFAQDPAAVSAAQAACGPKGVHFEVKDDHSQRTVGSPECLPKADLCNSAPAYSCGAAGVLTFSRSGAGVAGFPLATKKL